MVSFRKEVDNTIGELQKANAEGLSTIEQFEKKLTEEEAYKNALRKGAVIPDFSLPDTEGKMVNIRELYKDKYLVLVFYRGQWCPFCNLQLRDLQKHLSEIEGAPANLVAVSPQMPDKSVETKEKFKLNFTVLSDRGNEVARKFNLVYKLPDYLLDTYKGFGVNIQHYNGSEMVELPFPATYLINKEGVILKEYIGAKLNERAEGKDIVSFLKALL